MSKHFSLASFQAGILCFENCQTFEDELVLTAAVCQIVNTLSPLWISYVQYMQVVIWEDGVLSRLVVSFSLLTLLNKKNMTHHVTDFTLSPSTILYIHEAQLSDC